MDLKPVPKPVLDAASPDARFQDLDHWCTERLADMAVSPKQTALETVSGDASFRRYFRAHTAKDTSFIAVDAPPEHENCKPFVSIARSWREQGVRTPAVHSVDLGKGYMLLEDFGDTLLYSGLTGKDSVVDNAGRLYSSAFAALHTLQNTEVPADYTLPTYDESRLRQEMQLFPDWCLQQLLGLQMTDDQSRLLNGLFDTLVDSALEQPTVPVHRDYHSRNIMLLSDGLGLIDFQDAVLGPVTYDPVSLLRDCYIDWPQSQVYRWLDAYAAGSAHLNDVPQEQLYRWFDWMGAQRHLKVLGIFVRLCQRDGKHSYLKDIPRVYAYLRLVCGRYSELQEVARWLDGEVLPRLQQQSWWQDYQLQP